MSAIGEFAHPRVRLPGGAGSALILPTARRTILWRTQHTPRSLVERLDFVTAAGNVDRLVTPLCVFRMQHGRLVLEALMPGVDLATVQQQTGFAVVSDGSPARLPPPTEAELAALAAIDPERVRDVEFH